jgi:hypothetical protein
MPENMNIEVLARGLAELLTLLPDEKRKTFLDTLAERYCRGCGRDQEWHGKTCQCWNDE